MIAMPASKLAIEGKGKVLWLRRVAGFQCSLRRASTPSEQHREVFTDAMELYVLDHIGEQLVRTRKLLHAKLIHVSKYIYIYINLQMTTARSSWWGYKARHTTSQKSSGKAMSP